MIVLVIFVSTESVKQIIIIIFMYNYLCVYTIIGIEAVDASLYS